MYVQGDQSYHIRRDFTREMDSQNGPCDHLHANLLPPRDQALITHQLPPFH